MNNNDTIYSDIYSRILTKSQSDNWQEKLDRLIELLYTVSGKTVTQHIQEVFQEEVGVLISAIQKQGIDTSDITAVRTYLSGIRDILSHAKIADITIAIPADSALTEFLSAYVRELLASNSILLNIRTRQQIIGGAEVIINGHYWNFSLDKQVDEWFEAKRIGMQGNQLSVVSGHPSTSSGLMTLSSSKGQQSVDQSTVNQFTTEKPITG